MPSYRIFRLKDHQKTHFRQLPHMSGVARVKPRDYEEEVGAVVDAATPYAAWFAMKDTGSPLEVGDMIADEAGALRIVKFVGVEPAEWVLPEVKLDGDSVGAAASGAPPPPA